MSKQSHPALSESELLRYSRHISLPQIGKIGQEKLKRARVLCIGMGGLGSPAALYLAAAGIGTLGLIDPDRVELSNLQRQVLYAESLQGQIKVEAAKQKLLDLNPFVQINSYPETLHEQNAFEIINDYDLVVDGSDNFPTRFLVNDVCFYLKKPNVCASIFQFTGQISVFTAPKGACYRCLYHEAPPAELVPPCAEAGVFGALPGVIGSLQAVEVIKLITGVGQTLIGRVLLFDALTLSFREFHLQPNPDCVLCNQHTAFADLDRGKNSCQNTYPANEITVQELAELKAKRVDFVLLDVREIFEYEICNLGGELLPLVNIAHALQKFKAEQLIVVHCKTGGRSRKAQAFLMEHGFKQVKNLKGGILEWIKQIDPTLSSY